MIIICLEGCHGCGKSTMCAQFAAKGYRILDEGFMDMPDYALHPQTLLMETKWVCSWFERVLKIAHENKKLPVSEMPVLIADRSPFSAVYYANHGHLLEPLIRQQVLEIRTAANVELFTIHVQVEAELLWSRIQARLALEPNRASLQEHKRSWMDTTLRFYNEFDWDLTIPNNDRSIEETIQDVVRRASLGGIHNTSVSSIEGGTSTSTSSDDEEYCSLDEYM